MKASLAWFSPLRAQQKNVADYTDQLRPHLDQQFDVGYFADNEMGFLCTTSGKQYHCDVGAVPLSMIRYLNGGSTPIYHLGSSGEFGMNTWFLSRAKPGIVVLHDPKLHQSIYEVYKHRLGDRRGYLKVMYEAHGEPGLEAAAEAWEGKTSTDVMEDQFPLFALAIENALAVLVHTQKCFETIQGLTSTPVFYLPRPAPSPDGLVAVVEALSGIVAQIKAFRRRHTTFQLATNVGRNVASLSPEESRPKLAARYAEAIGELFGSTATDR